MARTVKENILCVLSDQNVSKSELSRRTGIHQPSLVKLLNGDSEIQTDTIQKIADALGVKFTELVIEHEHAA
ncbi:MAG: helix-turn-helix transcriptional regulator [Planctomycetaceae bacterium]